LAFTLSGVLALAGFLAGVALFALAGFSFWVFLAGLSLFASRRGLIFKGLFDLFDDLFVPLGQLGDFFEQAGGDILAFGHFRIVGGVAWWKILRGFALGRRGRLLGFRFGLFGLFDFGQQVFGLGIIGFQHFDPIGPAEDLRRIRPTIRNAQAHHDHRARSYTRQGNGPFQIING
jgi:hypothetical protein